MWLPKEGYVAIAFAGVLLSACSGGAETDEGPNKQPPVRPAKVIEVGAVEASNVRIFPGRVVAPTSSALSFDVSGRLVEFPVLEGSRVEEGELVAALDPGDYDERVTEARARVNLLERQLARQERLLEGGATSQAEYDQVRAEHDIAQANLETAQRDLAETRLLAPYAGTVARRLADLYTQVRAGQEIVVLQDDQQVDIAIQVPEGIIATATRDTPELSVSFDFAPERRFDLDVKEYQTTPEAGSGGYRVVLTMPRPDGLDLLPGMTGTVRAEFNTASAARATVPVASLVGTERGGFAVFVVDPESGTVSRRDVEVGPLTSGEAPVRSGLEAGDLVVAAGASFLRDGMRVRPLSE